MNLVESIRTIPDFPKPGIQFRDIMTLFGDARAFGKAVDDLVEPYADMRVDKVAGIEARGFILGGIVARELGTAFVPVRKKGKLPFQTLQQEYALEYGVNTIEIHIDAIQPGDRVIVIDDLIATGGTAQAAVKLVERAGGEVIGLSFVIDLPELGGAAKLRADGKVVRTLCAFDGH
jgi:adenine phosphoribosyltransferase